MLISLSEAGEILGVSRKRVYQFVQEGRLTIRDQVGVQGMILLDSAEVRRFGRRERPAGRPRGS